MKRIILHLCIAAGIVMTAAASGFAQLNQTYRAHIPFDFTVKNAEMKAGDYVLRPLTSTSGLGALQLAPVAKGKSRVLGVITPSNSRWDQNQSAGHLIFIKDGDDYTLSSVETASFKISMPKVTANARVLTKNTLAPASTVTVALQ